MVIWITGLSGAGKTTIGRLVYNQLKSEHSNTAFLDGDEVRDIFQFNRLENPYSLEARRKIGIQYHHMCRWLDRQDINVVCCTICSFPEIRALNREHFSNYLEVFIDVPLDLLIKRDSKDLYQAAIRGERKDVVGIDLPYDRPDSPDLVIDNSSYAVSPIEHACRILGVTLEKFEEQHP